MAYQDLFYFLKAIWLAGSGSALSPPPYFLTWASCNKKMFIGNHLTESKIPAIVKHLFRVINRVSKTTSIDVILVILLKNLNMHLSLGNISTKVFSKPKMKTIKKLGERPGTLNSKKVFSTGKAQALLELVRYKERLY